MEILLNLLKFACLVPLHVPTIYSKGLKRRGGRSIFFVRRIDDKWGLEVLVSPNLTG